MKPCPFCGTAAMLTSAARAEGERMRPVVEAAIEYYSAPCTTESRQLLWKVAEYEQAGKRS